MTEGGQPYIGRFAPSPTGPLHAGSLVAALASWLDAKAHGGRWLVRIEDIDTVRCKREHGEFMLSQLATCALMPDDTVIWQSERSALYQRALETLLDRGLAYGCACTRGDIALHWRQAGQTWTRHQEVPYPGTCRGGTGDQLARAIRFNTQGAGTVAWQDRRLGPQAQNVETQVGDFVLKRADGLWAYQMAVVVDDAAQGVTHVVRGEDLCDNTARQMLLQQALGYPTPHYFHGPLVKDAQGEKLSKQQGAQALDLSNPRRAMCQAAQVLGLSTDSADLSDQLARWVRQWQGLWP